MSTCPASVSNLEPLERAFELQLCVALALPVSGLLAACTLGQLLVVVDVFQIGSISMSGSNLEIELRLHIQAEFDCVNIQA
jgi:hypothetical protein